MFTTSILGLLRGSQSKLVDRLSSLVLRESSALDETSIDSELMDDCAQDPIEVALKRTGD